MWLQAQSAALVLTAAAISGQLYPYRKLLLFCAPWVEHREALLCVSLNKQEGICCLLLLLANTAHTVTATIITGISVATINNTTAPAMAGSSSVPETKHPSGSGGTVAEAGHANTAVSTITAKSISKTRAPVHHRSYGLC
ncbi:hypothetical protein EYF80_014454 [Liparis tanakae]|uniref:Uncharacterized protein n=1 Tax=Liparis tanakae TaxID=230148 RepID=A0A4Z2IBQ4_9TELE|nr:hypothetical protein EYF80_014454 [Liparis tanakae]